MLTTDLKPENAYLRVLLLGQPGTGKSTMASTFPKPYFFDFDNKMLGLAGVPDIQYDVFSDEGDVPKAWNTFIDKFRGLLATPGDRQTIVLDSFTTLQEIGLNEVQRVNNTYGKPVTLKEWGILSGMLNDILYMLKGVKNLHVVVTAHEEIVRDDERGMTYIMPVAMGKISATLPAFFHEVYRCRTRRTSHGVEYYIVTKALDNAPGNTILRGLGVEEAPNYKSIIAKDKAWREKEATKNGIY